MTEALVNGKIPVKYVHFVNGVFADSMDSRIKRGSREQALKDSNNRLAKLFSQAREHYLKGKDDLNANLLLKEDNLHQ